jgi:hypothetical protein
MRPLIALKLLFVSAIAVVISFAIAIAIGRYVPIIVEGRPPVPLEDRPYTMEELNKAREAMDARIEETRKRDNARPRSELLREMQLHAWWGTWIPWFLLPFVMVIANFKQVILVLVFPLMLVALAVSPIEQFGAFAVALAIGIAVKRFYSVNERAT